MTKSQSKASSTEAPEETGTNVVSVQERIKQRLANVNNSTAQPSSQKISLKGAVFTLPGGSTSPGPLNCIVLDYINNNAYYEQPYVEGVFALPDCYALGREIKSMVPAPEAAKPQSDDCESCPHNQFGSKGRGKMCQNGVLLAVIPEDFTAESEVFTVKVSPTAVTDWSSYVRTLQDGAGKDPAEVVTSFSFKEGLTYPSLKFKAIGPNTRLDEISAFLPTADTLLKASG